MEKLTTERLILREWKMEDAEDFFNNSKNDKVGPMAGWKPHENIEESKMILESFISSGETWAIVLKDGGRVIGSIGLHEDVRRNLGKDRVRMLGYVLAEDYWGRGYMPEACRAVIEYAFLTLDLELLSVSHFDFNTQSKRVIEKLEFTYEGTLRSAYLRSYDKEVFDVLCYSLTRSEYLAKYKPEGQPETGIIFRAVKMSNEKAEEFLSWRYDVPYKMFNYSPSEYFDVYEKIKDGKTAEDYFSVFDDIGDLSGIFIYGRNDDGIIECHFRLAPKLLGKGYGHCFVKTGISFCRKNYSYTGDIIAHVGKNHSVVKNVFKSLGFTEEKDITELFHGNDVEITLMLLKGE